MRGAGGTGLMLIVCGGLLTMYLIWGNGLVGALPSALIGLSMVAFGWSIMARERRSRRGRRKPR